MLVKITILSPFRYEYRGRQSWVATGEMLHLDTANADQKEELIYILSSNFQYKEFIHLDVKSLPKEIQCEVKDNKGFYNLPSTPLEIVKTPQPTEFFNPLGEAENNKFIKPIVMELIKDQNNDEAEPLIETSLDEDCTEEEELVEDTVSLHKRKDELTNTPWLRVKELVEEYGLTYTNKPEAIELIIDREFRQQ